MNSPRLILLIAFSSLCCGRLFAQIPAVALSDDVAALVRIDLQAIDLASAKAAAAAACDPPDLLVSARLVKFGLTQLTLLKLGVDTILIAIPNPELSSPPQKASAKPGVIRIAPPPVERQILILLHVPGEHADLLADTLKLLTLEQSQGAFKSVWQGDWLILHANDQPPNPKVVRGKSAAQFELGLEFLGKRPGVVVVPNPVLRKLAARAKKAAPARLSPASFDALGEILTSSWIAAAATVTDEPSFKIVCQSQDEAQAKHLVTSLERLQQELRNLTGKQTGHDDYVPLTVQVAKVLPSWKLRQSKAQAGYVLDARRLGELVKVGYVDPHYTDLELVDGKDHPWRNAVPLSTWIINYEILHQEPPGKLEDLKPLLGATPTQQDEHLRRLLTNSVTGEYPALAYAKPPATTTASDDDPIILRELQKGSFRRDGLLIHHSGWMKINSGSEEK